MTLKRIRSLFVAFGAVLVVWLMVLPALAQGRATVGQSFEGPTDCVSLPLSADPNDCETPPIRAFHVAPATEQAGGHGVINIWMRFCGTDYDPAAGQDFHARAITGATNTAPIEITTAHPHNLATGATVSVQGIQGNTAANTDTPALPSGARTIVVTSPNTFTLDGSDGTGSGTYEPGTGSVNWGYTFWGCNGRELSTNTFLKDFVLSLPPGLLGNPTAITTPCPVALFIISSCPETAVVGNSIGLGTYTGGSDQPIPAPTRLYVVDTIGPEPARLGTQVLPGDPPGPLPVLVNLRTSGQHGDFGVDSVVDTLPTQLGGQIAKIFTITTNLCPAAPCNFSTLAPLPGAKPFAVNPTSCKLATTRMLARPWDLGATNTQGPPPGPPSHAESSFIPTGCNNVPFGEDVYPPIDPARPSLDVTVTPVSKTAGEPTSTEVAIQYPDYASDAIWQSALKDAEVILPEGTTLAAGGGAGLESCPEAKIKLHTDDPVECPEGSRIGKVVVTSPALKDPLPGKAYLSIPPGNSAAPTEAKPWKLFIILEGQGVRVKLEGTVALIDNPATPDPNDRLIKNVFKDNPETPVSTFKLTTKGPDAADADNRGAAALANPNTCGIHKGDVKLYGYKNLGWSSTDPADPSGQQTDTHAFLPLSPEVNITGNCDRPFAPQVTAADAKPEDAGANSVSHLHIHRDDNNQNISRLTFSLPPGALGSLAAAPKCPAADAVVGNCSDETKVGIIRNTVGYGTSNLTVSGSLYIGEALQPGDAASFIIVVPAQVGPIDLGKVVVANRVKLRESDTGVDVISGEIPTTLQGIPLPIQDIDIVVNRENFFLNPTGCETRLFTATFTSDQGASATSSFPAQAKNCDQQRFAPKLRMIAGSKGFTKVGAFAPLKAIVTQTDGEAAIKSARVVVPDILRPNVPRFQKLANLCDGDQLAAHACPASSTIGSARVRTPVLPFELSGPVFAVLERGAPLPKLGVFLRGGGFEIVLVATNGFQGIKILNVFGSLPDTPQSYFELNINAGPTGALIAHDDLCTTNPLPVVEATFTSQGGKVFSEKPLLENNGCNEASVASLSIRGKRIRVSRKGVAKIKLRCAKRGPTCKGRLSFAKGYGKKSFSIKSNKTGTVKVKLTKKGKRAVFRAKRNKGKKVRTTVSGSSLRKASATITLLPPKKKKK
jgi:hypothetical protein